MPPSRSRIAPTTPDADADGTKWAEAWRSGASPEALEAEILASSQLAAGLHALARILGDDAVPCLAALARSSSALLAASAVEALGDLHLESSAVALEEISRVAEDRGVQKAARRSLYRLASQGIKITPAEPTSRSLLTNRQAEIYRTVASAIDGNGTRAIWIGAERPMGGIYMIALEMNDARGLTDCVGRDTTRKRFADQERDLRSKDIAAWVELPVEYMRELVDEGVRLARESGGAPASLAVWTETIGQPAKPFDQALIYEELSAFEMRMHPTLENETPQLFNQPEIEPWFFQPDEVRTYLQRITEPASVRLLVTPESDADRHDRILKDALKQLLPPRELHGLRRRLEETAYIFQRTDRGADARRAVAAAVTIEDERPLRAIHPFLRALMERSLGIAAEVERTGFEPMRLGRAP